MIQEPDIDKFLKGIAGQFKTYQGYYPNKTRGVLTVDNATPSKNYYMTMTGGQINFDAVDTFRPFLYYGNLTLTPFAGITGAGRTLTIKLRDIYSSLAYQEADVFVRRGVGIGNPDYDAVVLQGISFTHVNPFTQFLGAGDQFLVGMHFDGWEIAL